MTVGLDVVVGYAEFAATVRDRGVSVGPARTLNGVEGLSHLDPFDLVDIYWAGRLTMCGSKNDLERYNEAFTTHFGQQEKVRGLVSSALTAAPMHASSMHRSPDDADSSHEDDHGDELGAGASNAEILRKKDFISLSEAERAELARLMQMLAVHPSWRRSLRFRPSRRGPVDVGRSLRSMARSGGELVVPMRRTRDKRHRRTVLLLDVSGSMRPYADALLRFAHAAVRVAPNDTEVFTIATRLNRVTSALKERDSDRAMAACYSTVSDWEGGTRLGEALAQFLSAFGRSGMARRAVVVVASDGWERGDATLLGDQMAALSLLAHKVFWIHPYQGKPGFVPVTNGMTAVLPHIDALIAGHSLQSLEAAAELIANA